MGKIYNHSPKNYLTVVLNEQKTAVWWYMPVIPATWEVEMGGSWFKGSLDNKS
jgi:hypothetical protein